MRLWYTDTGGAGEAVVFLHAATGSSRVWEYQIPAFVARGYRVIAYDRRGFGRTVIDPAGAQPGTGADDLLALVNHLKIDRFHLVGTAAGPAGSWRSTSRCRSRNACAASWSPTASAAFRTKIIWSWDAG